MIQVTLQVTEPPVQLEFVSGTICRQTSDSRTYRKAVPDSRRGRFYLASGTDVQCEYPFNCSL